MRLLQVGIVGESSPIRKLYRSGSKMIPQASGSGAAGGLAGDDGKDFWKALLAVGELAG